LGEFLRNQKRSPQDILGDSLDGIYDYSDELLLIDEIEVLEEKTNRTKEEQEELNGLKTFTFIRDQEVFITEFLIQQYNERDEFFSSLQSA
jgi:hypothetical protein